jgi:pSer/pThr/pTyr-binding forkhead associated (FHA) protein/limonene-1,2-epoxide hydrolase
MKAVLNGPLGSTILETTLFTIGSSPDNSLVIDNVKVSAHHAAIHLEEQGFSITDLGSIHGTYVNAERLDFNTPRLLSPGNSIAFGNILFTYEMGVMPQTEETAATSPKQEGDSGTPSEENIETLPTSYGMDTISGSPENQQLVDVHAQYTLPQQYMPSYTQQPGNTAFIPADYDGPIPGYVPIKQVRRRDRRFILIGLGLLVVIVLSVAGYFYFNRSTPEKTLDAFCNALQEQNYQTAYNQLSNSIQNRETELEFSDTSQAGGKVSTCTHSSANTTNNRATANMRLVTGSGQTSSSIVTLMADSGNIWKMSLFPTTPGMTLTAFCNALQNKDYPTAYTQLSSAIKRAHAEAQFEIDFSGFTCSYSAVSPSGSTASTTVMFRNASGQIATSTVTLIQDSNSNDIWKINSIQF